jgi:hypothetical protein
MWQVKSAGSWVRKFGVGKLEVRKFAKRSLLLASAALLAPLALVPAAKAQVVVSLTPPGCAYGYYEYAPYGCAPSGFYGPGYFHNGIFLGVGPWANWGYGHGWGEYRFRGGGGGRYVAGRGGRGYAANRGRGPGPAHANRAHAQAHPAAAHGGGEHGGEEHK